MGPGGLRSAVACQTGTGSIGLSRKRRRCKKVPYTDRVCWPVLRLPGEAAGKSYKDMVFAAGATLETSAPRRPGISIDLRMEGIHDQENSYL